MKPISILLTMSTNFIFIRLAIASLSSFGTGNASSWFHHLPEQTSNHPVPVRIRLNAGFQG